MRRLKQQPVVSATLVILNAGIFLVCMFGRISLTYIGGLDYTVLEKKDYWRIITAMFLHSSIDHLFSNMIILFFVGAIIEKEIGHIKFAILYLMSGVCGNLLSLLEKVTTESRAYSIGASGAVFGLDGALLAMVLFWDRKLLQVTPARVAAMILLSVYSGFTGDNIDNAAHVGGLAAGFLLGCIICLLEQIKKKYRQSKHINDEVTN